MNLPKLPKTSILRRQSVWLCFCVGLYILLSLSSFLAWPLLSPDEANFGEIAKTLAEEGHLGSHLVRGLERHVYWQPPGYFMVAAAVIKTAGFHIEALRIFSMSLGAIVLLLTYRFARIVVHDPRVAALSILLLATHPNFVGYIKMARMDALCMVFIMAALVVYASSIQRERHTIPLLLSGIFIAFAVVTHPLGLIPAAVVSLHVLTVGTSPLRNRVKQLLPLLAPTLLGLGVWSWYIMQDVPAFEQQMTYQFVRKSRPLLEPVLAWLRGNRTTPLFLLLFLSCFPLVVRDAWRGRLPMLWLLVMASAGSCLIVALAFEFSYQVYFLPFAAITGAYALTELGRIARGSFLKIIRLVPAAIVLNGLAFFLVTSYLAHVRYAEQNDYYRFVQRISDRLPGAGAVYFCGNPTVYWGLYQTSPNRRYVEAAQLRGEADTSILDGVQHVVMSQTSVSGNPAGDLSGHRTLLDSLCARRGERLLFVDAVGLKERFAYSADIFRIQPVR